MVENGRPEALVGSVKLPIGATMVSHTEQREESNEKTIQIRVEGSWKENWCAFDGHLYPRYALKAFDAYRYENTMKKKCPPARTNCYAHCVLCPFPKLFQFPRSMHHVVLGFYAFKNHKPPTPSKAAQAASSHLSNCPSQIDACIAPPRPRCTRSSHPHSLRLYPPCSRPRHPVWPLHRGTKSSPTGGCRAFGSKGHR